MSFKESVISAGTNFIEGFTEGLRAPFQAAEALLRGGNKSELKFLGTVGALFKSQMENQQHNKENQTARVTAIKRAKQSKGR